MQTKVQQQRQFPRLPSSYRCDRNIKRSLVVREALTWEGVKFKHQGRSKVLGTDCAGVLIGVARALDLDKQVNFKDFRQYARMPDGNRMKQLLDTFMIRIKQGDELPGDFYHMSFTTIPQHLAMVMPNNEILHAASSFGKVVRHRLDDEWRFIIYGAYRYKGVI